MKLRRVCYSQGGKIDVLVEKESLWFSLGRNSAVTDKFDYTEKDGFTDPFIVLDLIRSDVDFRNGILADADKTGPVELARTSPLIPIPPKAYRDFMLYESHVINASRGYVKKFMPGAYRISRLYEKIIRRPFPPFRPARYWYRSPMFYFGNHLNFSSDGNTLSFPGYCDGPDYELELGVFITKELLNATVEEAREAMGGFVILNDLSMRGIQVDEMKSGFGPQKAKSFANMMGPVLATADSVGDYSQLSAGIRINGETVVTTSTAGMYHDLAKAIAYASKGETLHPGEFFGSGTLPGGSGMENGYWIQPGDTVAFFIENLDHLEFTWKK